MYENTTYSCPNEMNLGLLVFIVIYYIFETIVHVNLAIESVCKLFFVIVCVHIFVSVKLEYFHSFTVIPATPILQIITIFDNHNGF